MTKRVFVAGYYGFGNLGDEAILAGMIHSIRVLMSEVSFVVASRDPKMTKAMHGCDAIPSGNLNAVVEAMRECDAAILGGGGLFNDYWPSKKHGLLTSSPTGLERYVTVPVLARIMGIPSMIYSVGVGPLKASAACDLVATAFEVSSESSVRDLYSMKLVRGLIGLSDAAKARTRLTADPAFAYPMSSSVSDKSSLRDIGLESDRWTLAVCPRHWDLGEPDSDWGRELVSAIDSAIEAHDGQAIFVPADSAGASLYTNDLAVCQRLFSALRKQERARIASPSGSLDRFSGLLASSSVVVSMRMHGVLIALRHCVPVVALAYDPKVESLLNQAGLGVYSLPPGEWRRDAILEGIQTAWENRDQFDVQEYLDKAGSLAEEDALRAVELVQGGLKSPSAAQSFMARVTIEKVLEAAQLRDEIYALRQEHVALAEAATELDRLRHTIGVRLLNTYWTAAKRALPEGSLGRYVHKYVRGWARNALGIQERHEGLGYPARGDRHVVPGTSPQDSSLLKGEWLGTSRQVLQGLASFMRGREADGRTCVVMLSATWLDRSEGQRATHLAEEMARRNLTVVFGYWRWRHDEWASQDMIDQGIFELPVDTIVDHPQAVMDCGLGADGIVFVEFPHPELLGFIAEAESRGWLVVYDVVDDWADFCRVGQAEWYSESFERYLLSSADLVTCVSPRLASHLSERRSNLIQVANAVDPRMARVDEPRHLKRGELTLGYFGYLSNAWFNWDLLVEVAQARPSWMTYLIGYGEEVRLQRLPENIIFLGKRPAESLASFTSNWDVALVPFRPIQLSANADPIKTYEYIALGLPVLLTGAHPPSGADPFVARVEGREEFIAKAMDLAARGVDPQARDAFIAGNTWSVRVDRILEALNSGSGKITKKLYLAGKWP